ncbi:GNAT family N-acetyltransferase [Brochothrix campestris]|uniref:Acetyltransferase family protein n=1 Tax=Brochothrix campestris FSL F6-1037 TaxID=1265861 RepID=W7CSU9_9LIST|nr:GNAT family N-acetyltransferase [Brochothrix campestris]EUJ39967.1 acetyltransferase family protein [Brochothrix campestris FSL F6-1037]
MIRIAQAKDAAAITAIYNEAILKTTAIYKNDPVTVADRRAWIARQAQEGWPLFVYEIDETVVGYATYGSFRAYPGYRQTIEHSIYVNPTSAGRGIATALMQHLIAIAKQEGYHVMLAGIDSENSASIHLHKKLGFTFSGRMKEVGFKFDRWLDVDFYQMVL